jgi:hypothetical protein
MLFSLLAFIRAWKDKKAEILLFLAGFPLARFCLGLPQI